ncbi:MAG: radical SAM family heme chaperone HemW [Planctomycetota bacterium]
MEPTGLKVLRQRPRHTAAAALVPDAKPSASGIESLYIHIPFCFHKCHYCDFYSLVDTRDRQDTFTDRLIEELGTLAPHAGKLRTIFVGGGTPTLLRHDLWKRLLETLNGSYDCSLLSEFTVECNPETASPKLFDTLRAGGVSRLSMGAQSFNLEHLRTLERHHDPESVARAATHARAAGIDRLSIDLIFGIPGQTLTEHADDLDRALDLGTEHLSCYALTYEPGTAMTSRLSRGEFEPASEEIEAQMLLQTRDTLARAGLNRYEVSNFARPGAECAHNLAYWRQDDWLAAGPSASGHARGARWKNVPRLDDYIAQPGYAPVIDFEPPDPARNLSEKIMTGLRLREGIDADAILASAERLGCAPDLADEARRAKEQGLLEDAGGRWRPTDSGFLVADRLASGFMARIP